MWLTSLDNKQFKLYAQQTARLNTSYWLGSLIRDKCESSIGAVDTAEIESFDRQIKLLLKHIRKDIRKQKGMALEIIKSELKHVAYACRVSINLSKKTSSSRLLGFACEAADNKIFRKEMEFLEHKFTLFTNNNMYEGDLNAHWDRAMQLIYQVIDTNLQSGLFSFRRKELRQKLDMSVNLLSPTSENLRTYVNSYVTQLQLERFESASLEAQLFEDYQNQFTVGTELLRWVREVVLIKPGVLAKIFDRKGIEAAAARQIEVGDDIHKRLITAVIAPSDTIRRIIDVHVVD
jgi:hypothetical protein